MSRYVDVEELKNSWVTYGSLGVMDMLLDDTFPTVDAVEVVRCKDCRHKSGSCCLYSTLYLKPDGFCSHGKKEMVPDDESRQNQTDG